MKTVLATLGCVLGVVSAFSQGFSVQVVLEQDSYLAGETLIAKVRVSNFSGQNLRFGKEADWLTFTVENAEHSGVSRQGTVPVMGEFTLEPSMTGAKKVNLAPYFELTRAGRYSVTASVTSPELRQTAQSKPVTFDIINGSSIWQQEFGVPGTGQDTGMPEMRRYSLVQTLHSKSIKLYLRLTDVRQTRIFAVYPLGAMASFGSPEPQLDKFNNLHVLFQTGPRVFVHCLINPDGVLIARESYDLVSTRPVLHPESDGRVTVLGGTRHPMASDLPPPADASSISNAKSDQP